VIKKIFTIVVLALMAVSCNCSSPLRIKSIQKSDKKLACKDLILEINETEHYRNEAIKGRGINLTNMLAPTCWVTGYLDSEQGLKAANARIDYLGHIYDLLDCGGSGKRDGGMVAIPVAPRKVPAKTRPVPIPQGQTGYRQVKPMPGAKVVDPWLHEHVTKARKVYQHSHPHSGSHIHESNVF
jgi:hypothetical protein